MFKSEKGITLVALVITIIVLLILAGITLMLALGDNGILGQAENARMVQIEADTKETMELAILAAKTEMAAKTASIGSTAFTPAEVKTMLEASLPKKSDGTSDYKVNSPAAAGSSGSIVYTGQNYKGATDQSTAELTYTFTLSSTGQTISNGTYTTNATNSPMYVAPPVPGT